MCLLQIYMQGAEDTASLLTVVTLETKGQPFFQCLHRHIARGHYNLRSLKLTIPELALKEMEDSLRQIKL